MYCRLCGKQIADNSIFCQYCGGKVNGIALDPDKDISRKEKNTIEYDQELVQEAALNTKDNVTIPKPTNKKSIIANDIVGNLKMIGLAIICCTIFMIGFIIYHQKDIKEHPEYYYGKSCYDEPAMERRFGSFDWKEILSDHKQFLINNHFQIHQSEEELEEMAKEWAKKNKTDFSNYVNYNRESKYKKDLIEKAKYSAVIMLIFFIAGRYFIQLSKWVKENKTENLKPTFTQKK